MEENDEKVKSSRRRLGPILWPLVLIAFGLLLLLDNLGLLGQSAWNVIWKLWPLLFIALGLDALFRKKEIFSPVFWIGLGGVFLLYNFGLVGWETWNTLFRLWPVLLVTAGLELLLGRRSVWISLPASALVLVIIAFALGLTGFQGPAEMIETTSINEPLGQATRAELIISMAVGDLTVNSLNNPNALITGDIDASEGGSVRTHSTTRGDTIVYTVEHNNPIVFPFADSWKWDLELTTQVPVDLETKMGVGSIGLVLDEMLLDTLNVDQAVGEIEVILPDGDYNAEINQAVGQIILEIPEDIPLRLEISRAVSGLSLPSNFEKRGDFYYSPEARGADEYLRIEISQAVGSITIQYDR